MERTSGNAEGSASVDGVVLGVDTHLDPHVAVATYLAPTTSLTFSVSGFCSLALLRSCSSCR